MSSPFIGEIRMFGGNFAPAGWMFCDGSLLDISQYDTLFNLIGTTYGGDGQATFALPDLRGRLPLHMGTGSSGTSYTLAQSLGVESVTLVTQQLPSHDHPLIASTSVADLSSANGAFLAQPQVLTPYSASPGNVSLDASSLGNDGGGQPHTNLQPYLCISFIISLFGIYPSPT
jgi:microcystin-dependent protein